MESLLAHFARKERRRLRIRRVDVDEHPAWPSGSASPTVPTLVLVIGKRAVGRLDGPRERPRIEALLEQHLDAELAAA